MWNFLALRTSKRISTSLVCSGQTVVVVSAAIVVRVVVRSVGVAVVVAAATRSVGATRSVVSVSLTVGSVVPWLHAFHQISEYI